ncbi:hypothetical protein H6P81_019156 [Aristolochia fimbriata]|uniref:Uncharacterized protein n=1 Tax=Aristolochia fimbriata TaxID=158543 RepID=A0AAV7DTL4_ARIFI|nr:hypothetical protein H6P81_019156 [Aristolochia fimbriata]
MLSSFKEVLAHTRLAPPMSRTVDLQTPQRDTGSGPTTASHYFKGLSSVLLYFGSHQNSVVGDFKKGNYSGSCVSNVGLNFFCGGDWELPVAGNFSSRTKRGNTHLVRKYKKVDCKPLVK